jgi:hypothetical protein
VKPGQDLGNVTLFAKSEPQIFWGLNLLCHRPNKSKSTKVGLYLKGQVVNACKKPDWIDPLADIEMSRRLGGIIWESTKRNAAWIPESGGFQQTISSG